MLRLIFILFIAFYGISVSAAPGLSPRTYNKLTSIQENIDEVELEAEGALEALTEIDETLAEMTEDLAGSPLGLALTLQTRAQLNVRLEKTTEAIAYLKRAVAIKEIEESTKNQLTMFLAQLLFTTEQYRDVVTILEPWLKDKSKEKPAGAYAMLAATYYTLNELKKGLPYIELANEVSAKPKEPWLQMAFSGNYQQADYSKALKYLDLLVFNFPDKKDYWHQKAGVLQMQERYEEAAVVKELAYKRGFIETESEFLNLGQLLASQGAAYKTAVIIEDALNSQKIEATEKLVSLLQQAWLQAKEMDKAREALTELFSITKKPDDGIRLLQFQVDGEQWESAIATGHGLLKLELTDKEQASTRLYQGMAMYRSGSVDQAISTLAKATSQKHTVQAAKAWIAYIKNLTST